ncbi:MAG TPA: multidrug transporter subunit MdtD [Rhodocyclaceae bacterium]
MEQEQRLRMLLWLVAIAFFMQTLDATIVNTALPAMAISLGESPLKMHSVVVSYALTMAALIPASGWLADRFGTRRTFMGAIVLFSLGSLACAMSHSLPQLVAARVLQGLGGALLLPVGRLAVLRAFPRERFLAAMSFVTVPGLIGPLIGPTLGGWLVEVASWHWIFLINLPVGLLGIVLTQRYMLDERQAKVGSFDLIGYVLLTFSMIAISLAVDGFSDFRFGHATILLMLMFGLASLAAYWLRAARRPDALFSLRLFHINTFSVGILGNLFARIGSGAMPFLIPLLLQVCLDYTPAQAGQMLIPVAAAAIFSKRIGPGLIRRFSYRRVLLCNTLLVGATIASFGLIGAAQPVWLLLLQLACFGAVNSLQFTAMNTITLFDLEGSNASSGNSLLSMVMMLSMSLGVAAAGGLLAAFATQDSGGVQTLDAFHATFVTVGLITCASSWIFWQLAPAAGSASRKQTAVGAD